MKNLLLIAVAFFVFSGCCTKKLCLLNENKAIYFTGFDSSDLSEIVITIKQKDFPTSIDSFITSAEMVNGKMVWERLSGNYTLENYAYSFSIQKLNRKYVLDNFTYTKVRITCNRCFKREYTNKLTSYNINGISKEFNPEKGFEISK